MIIHKIKIPQYKISFHHILWTKKYVRHYEENITASHTFLVFQFLVASL